MIGTLILGTMTSGFTVIGVDPCLQDIVKGILIVAAVVAYQCRQIRDYETRSELPFA